MNILLKNLSILLTTAIIGSYTSVGYSSNFSFNNVNFNNNSGQINFGSNNTFTISSQSNNNISTNDSMTYNNAQNELNKLFDEIPQNSDIQIPIDKVNGWILGSKFDDSDSKISKSDGENILSQMKKYVATNSNVINYNFSFTNDDIKHILLDSNHVFDDIGNKENNYYVISHGINSTPNYDKIHQIIKTILFNQKYTIGNFNIPDKSAFEALSDEIQNKILKVTNYYLLRPLINNLIDITTINDIKTISFDVVQQTYYKACLKLTNLNSISNNNRIILTIALNKQNNDMQCNLKTLFGLTNQNLDLEKLKHDVTQVGMEIEGGNNNNLLYEEFANIMDIDISDIINQFNNNNKRVRVRGYSTQNYRISNTMNNRISNTMNNNTYIIHYYKANNGNNKHRFSKK